MSDDAFEAKYMRDGSAIVHRDKRISRKMAALLAAPGLLILVGALSTPLMNATSTRPMPPPIVPVFTVGMVTLALLMFLLAIMFAVLRFIVTERAIHVKYGLFGPTIPLESVISCNVVEYDWTKYGGWGIRRASDGSWAYVPSNGSVVEVRYRAGAKEKKVLLGAQDAHALARSINEARSNGGRRARIATNTSTPDVEQPAEVEEAPETSARRQA